MLLWKLDRFPKPNYFILITFKTTNTVGYYVTKKIGQLQTQNK